MITEKTLPSCLTRRFCVGLLIVLCLGLYMPQAWQIPLADPEESRCALVVQYMIQSGQWLMPHLDGELYFDKPAPYFWLAAAGQMVTGSIEFGGRLVSALFAIAAVLMAFSAGRRMGDNLAGLVAGIVLATSVEFAFMARWYRMDMPFAALIWAALWWFWRYETPLPAKPDAGRQLCPAQWLGFYILAAGATMMKGPIGLAIPAMVITVYFVLSRQFRRLLHFFYLPGIVAYLAVAAPWYVAVSSAYPRYPYEFFFQQNISRFSNGNYSSHTLYGIGYIAVIFLGFLPWAVYLPGALMRTLPQWRLLLSWTRIQAPVSILWLSVLVPLAAFCCSRTQLPNYILPIWPSLAVLLAIPLAKWISSGQPDRLYKHGARGLTITIGLMAAAIVGMEYHFRWLSLWSIAPLVVGGLSAAMMTRSLLANRRLAWLAWATLGIFGILIYITVEPMPKCFDKASFRTIAATVKDQPGLILCSWGASADSLPLYAGKTSMLKFPRDEKRGVKLLVRYLATTPNAYCLLRVPGKKAKGVDMAILNKETDRQIIIVAQQGDMMLIKLAPAKPETGQETRN